MRSLPVTLGEAPAEGIGDSLENVTVFETGGGKGGEGGEGGVSAPVRDWGVAPAAVLAARAAGILLDADGADLLVQAAAPPALLEMLSSNTAIIVDYIRPGAGGWSAEAWQAYFDERAGIAEFDGELARDQAEAQAFSCFVVERLNRHPVSSPNRRCLTCGSGEEAHEPLLPFGLASTGHAWPHSRCWRTWADGRKAEAISALAVIGIAAPANLPNDFGKNGGA